MIMSVYIPEVLELSQLRGYAFPFPFWIASMAFFTPRNCDTFLCAEMIADFNAATLPKARIISGRASGCMVRRDSAVITDSVRIVMLFLLVGCFIAAHTNVIDPANEISKRFLK